jgi:hypothetical protein
LDGVSDAFAEIGDTVDDVDITQILATLNALDAGITTLTKQMAFRSDVSIDWTGFIGTDEVTNTTFPDQVKKRLDITRALEKALNDLPDMSPTDEELERLENLPPTKSSLNLSTEDEMMKLMN